MHKLMMVIKTETRLTFRNGMSLFFALAFPTMMLLIFGEMYGNEPSTFFGGRGGMDVLVPAYICMIIAVTGIMSLPLTVAQYRERKILKRYKATPIKQFDILLAQVIANVIMTLMGILLLLIVAKLKYNLHFEGNFFITLAVGLLITASVFSIGLLVSGVASSGKSATTLSYLIYFPMLFLSGATMPLEMFPKNLVTVSHFLPLTYAVQLIQGVWFGESITGFGLEVGILVAITLAFGGASIKFFKWE